MFILVVFAGEFDGELKGFWAFMEHVEFKVYVQ